ncbi:MAG TPA: cohesin domain-containing protein [Pyrinomonadaceae bacterium]|jgi:hypothetical protein
MSRRKRKVGADRPAAQTRQAGKSASARKKFITARHICVAFVLLGLAVLGVAGAFSEKYKYSLPPGSTDSTGTAAEPLPALTGTPKLSKEYIYAGGRMLAAVDDTANVGSNTMSGKAVYGATPANEKAKSVPGVWLNSESLHALTDLEGRYEFPFITPGANLTVTPTKSGGVYGAITPFDATMILRHIADNGVGPNALSPNQQIVADTNGNGYISPYDATLILKYIAAGQQTPDTVEVANWKFSPASKYYPSFSGPLTDQDYTAFLIGDVNGGWTPPKSSNTQSYYYNIQIYPDNVTAASGSTILIPVFFSNTGNQAVSSYSFQFTFDPWVLEPNSAPISASGTLSAGCQPSTNTGSSGVVGVSVYCPTPISASSGTLLYLRFNVRDDEYMPGETLLSFKYSNEGTTPLFEDSQGNRIGSMPGSGYFTLETPPEAAANDSLSNQKSEDSSATVAGIAKAFVPPAEQQQQQQQQQPATDEMQISLPQNAAATPGSTLSIPVTLTNSTGKQVSGFNFDVQYNPALLQPAGTAVETTGTLSSKCEVVEYTVTRGRVKIVGACDKDITAQAGTLVKLRFAVAGQANNASAEARALKFRQIPVFENHKGRQIEVGRSNGSIR